MRCSDGTRDMPRLPPDMCSQLPLCGSAAEPVENGKIFVVTPFSVCDAQGNHSIDTETKTESQS